jgi:nucleoid-associated protein YgaU
MKKSALMSLIAVALACVVGLAACGPKPDSDQPPAEPPPPEPAAEPAQEEAPAEPANEEAPAEPAEGSAKADEGAAPAAAAGAALDANTIVGTKWKYEAYEIKFEPDGKLMLNDAIPGTWALEGTKLTVGALGQEFEVEVKGSNLVVEGEELSQIK